MSLNPHYCEGCAERGSQLGVVNAERDRLRLHLDAANEKIATLEQELRIKDGHHRDEPRRDVLASPMLNRPGRHPTW